MRRVSDPLYFEMGYLPLCEIPGRMVYWPGPGTFLAEVWVSKQFELGQGWQLTRIEGLLSQGVGDVVELGFHVVLTGAGEALGNDTVTGGRHALGNI